MPEELFREIVNLLILHLNQESSRKAFVNLAWGPNTPLESHINWSGAAREFTVHLIKVAMTHSEDNGKVAIDKLLDQVAADTGHDSQKKIEGLRTRLVELGPSEAHEWKLERTQNKSETRTINTGGGNYFEGEVRAAKIVGTKNNQSFSLIDRIDD